MPHLRLSPAQLREIRLHLPYRGAPFKSTPVTDAHVSLVTCVQGIATADRPRSAHCDWAPADWHHAQVGETSLMRPIGLIQRRFSTSCKCPAGAFQWRAWRCVPDHIHSN